MKINNLNLYNPSPPISSQDVFLYFFLSSTQYKQMKYPYYKYLYTLHRTCLHKLLSYHNLDLKYMFIILYFRINFQFLTNRLLRFFLELFLNHPMILTNQMFCLFLFHTFYPNILSHRSLASLNY